MNMQRYQELVVAGMFVRAGVDKWSHTALGMAGEAGEVADLIKKSQYEGRALDDAAKVKLVEECGDALWYLTYMCELLGITLGELAVSNIAKLHARHPHRYPDLAAKHVYDHPYNCRCQPCAECRCAHCHDE